MAKVRIRYVAEDIDRHGNVRTYVRVPGRRKVRIRAALGTPEFWKAYHAALEPPTDDAPLPPAICRAETGSLRWLCERYYQSAEYKRLSPRTRVVRQQILERVLAKDGDKPFRLLEPRHVRKMRDERAETPESANAVIKSLRQVFAFAVDAEHTDRNPIRDVPYIRTRSSGFHSWTMEEVRQYEERHAIGTKARLAMALLLFTGARRSDAVTFGRQHVRDGWLTYTATKTRTKISVPVLPELQSIIDQSPRGELTFITTAFARPFTAAGFGNRFRKWCDEAGLPHCSAHGLRKAGAAIAAENGATDRQLMAIFGWTSAKEATRYTRAARQRVLAASGMPLLSIGKTTPK